MPANVMRKEIIFAIIAGIGIGLIIGFGAWRANKALNQNQTTITQESGPDNSNGENSDLELTTPRNFSVSESDSLQVTGITSSNSLVVIETKSGSQVIRTNEEGVFETEVNLSAGINIIKTTAFVEGGLQSEESYVVYSSEFFDLINEGPESTDSADFQKEAQNKAEIIKKSPTAYLGTVTDISEGSIKLDSIEGSVLQASVNYSTTFTSTIKGNSVNTIEDLAIGDFIAVLGITDGNSVLEAVRLIVSEMPVLASNVYFGEIQEISGKVVTLKSGDTEISVNFPIRWNGPELEELEIGMSVIVIGELNEGVLLLETIEIAS